jgi:hypothetical protein
MIQVRQKKAKLPWFRLQQFRHLRIARGVNSRIIPKATHSTNSSLVASNAVPALSFHGAARSLSWYIFRAAHFYR